MVGEGAGHRPESARAVSHCLGSCWGPHAIGLGGRDMTSVKTLFWEERVHPNPGGFKDAWPLDSPQSCLAQCEQKRSRAGMGTLVPPVQERIATARPAAGKVSTIHLLGLGF